METATDTSTDALVTTASTAPWESDADPTANTRSEIICAHRMLLRAIFHEPLNLQSQDFGTVVRLVYNLVRVADAYDTLKLLTIPIENVFARYYKGDITTMYKDHYQELVFVATKINTKWLFREVVCRIIPDPSERREEFEGFSEFVDREISSLVTQKRNQLISLMYEVDHKLMMLRPPKRNVNVRSRTTINAATAAFRSMIYKHFQTHSPDFSYFNYELRSLQEIPDFTGFGEGRPASALLGFIQRLALRGVRQRSRLPA